MKSLNNYIVESQKVKLDSDGKEHGFEYADLGLPSGTMWATCNIGADKPEDDGLLFQFGRVDGYKYGDKNHKFSISDENLYLTGSAFINPTTSGTKYDIGKKLSLDDDAAHVNMGGKWVMPTKADLQELYDNTKKQVVTINGKKGMLFTSKLNGKSIFVVFGGWWNCFEGQFYDSHYSCCLRSSVVRIFDDDEVAWMLYCNSIGGCNINSDFRSDGYSVRGVFKK